MPIRIGTRASSLARWQADWVAAQLRHAGVDVELVPMTTAGDRRRGPIGRLGGSGIFTKEIQRALLDNRIDLAVHSLKDLPTAEVPGLTLAAVPERGPVADVLVLRNQRAAVGQGQADITVGAHWPISLLPPGARVGTGSPRRRAQLMRLRPDLHVGDLRGNVETRLRKLDQGAFDAILLAEAALRRLDDYKDYKGVGSLYCRAEQAGCVACVKDSRPLYCVVGVELIVPAVGQGALAVEARADDLSTCRLAASLDHPATRAAVTAERTMLGALGGGCLAPVAAWANVENDRLHLRGRVLSRDGDKLIEAVGNCRYDLSQTVVDPFAAARQLGEQVAEALLSNGAATLIAQSRA